ncbi:hypothetical protein FKM82_015377 [Ascaphus truei]
MEVNQSEFSYLITDLEQVTNKDRNSTSHYQTDHVSFHSFKMSPRSQDSVRLNSRARECFPQCSVRLSHGGDSLHLSGALV